MAKRKHQRKREYSRSEDREAYDYHLPVMLKECCDALIKDPSAIYIDGTLGGGGHSSEILNRLAEDGRLYAFDKDEEAIDRARLKFATDLDKGAFSKLILINDGFENAFNYAKCQGEPKGILLDLGISSRQVDSLERGFSYRGDSRLDMRFGRHGQSAQELLNAVTEETLERHLRLYGEEPFSRAIARRIAEIRRIKQIETTRELRLIIEETVPKGIVVKSLARVFQAIRIAVNDELGALETALQLAISNLGSGGRIVVMSYHSLEDRIVKSIFKECSNTNKHNEDKANSAPKIKLITKKPIIPSDEEIARNPRARSAKLRIAEIL